MTIIRNPPITSFPNKFGGFQVLLVESDKKTLQHHTYMLLHNSYKVTSTEKASTALSMILNGNVYDCLLTDADKPEMDMMDFLYQCLKKQPQLSVIVMGSRDNRMRVAKENLGSDAVYFLPKPCGVKQICNFLELVCRKRIGFVQGTAFGKSLQLNKERNIANRIDTMVHPSSILNSALFNNNIPSTNGTHQGLNIYSQEYGAMSKPGTYVDISSDDDGSWQNRDTGEHPLGIKRKNYLSLEDDSNRKKRKEIKTRIAWTPALDTKFKAALEALGEENAFPNAILKHMNVQGLTRHHVASHLQKYQLLEREKNMKKNSIVALMQKGNTSHGESYASNRYGLSTRSLNNGSILESSNLQKPFKFNSGGVSFMTLGSVKDKLHEVPPSTLPQQTATAINNSGGDVLQPLIGEKPMSCAFGLVENLSSGIGQGSEVHMPSAFGEAMPPLMVNQVQMPSVGHGKEIQPLVTGENFSHPAFGEALPPLGVSTSMESLFTLGTDASNFSNGFDNANSWGSIVSEVETTPFNQFGLPIEPLVSGGGGNNVSEVQTSAFNHFGLPIEPLVSGGSGGNNVSEVQTSAFNPFGLLTELCVSGGAGGNNVSEVQPTSPGHFGLPTDLWVGGGGGGDSVSDVQTILSDHFGPPVETWVNGGGGNSVSEVQTTPSVNFGPLEPLVSGAGNNVIEIQTTPSGPFGLPIDTWVGGGDNGVSEVQTNPSDHFGPPIEPWVLAAGGGSSSGSGSGSGISDTAALVPFDRFGLPIEMWVPGSGGVAASSDDGLEDLTFPEGKDLFEVEYSTNLSHSNSEPLIVGNESAGFPLTRFPGEDNVTREHIQPALNSIVPADGSNGGVLEDDQWFPTMVQGEDEISMEDLFEACGS